MLGTSLMIGGYAALAKVKVTGKKGTYANEGINFIAELDASVAGSEGSLTCKHSSARSLRDFMVIHSVDISDLLTATNQTTTQCRCKQM